MTEVVTEIKGGCARRQQPQVAKRAPTRLNPARIARQLAHAQALRHRHDGGEFAELALQLGFNRARVRS